MTLARSVTGEGISYLYHHVVFMEKAIVLSDLASRGAKRDGLSKA